MWVRMSIRARCTPLCDKVCQWLATSRGFSLSPLVSFTNKTDRHDITEILLKVALNTIKQTNKQTIKYKNHWNIAETNNLPTAGLDSNNRLIHEHFHIGLVIIPRPPYWPETQSRANMGRGMITIYYIHVLPTYRKETPILAWDEVEAHIGPGQYGPRYGNDLVVIQ
jgi:hypothetical protein